MRLTLLVLNVRLRCFGRFLAANAFVIFVLGPLLVGAALWVVDRYVLLVRGPLAGLLAAGPGTVGFVLALAMTVLVVPSVTREIFPGRHARSALDALPVSEATRFQVSLLATAARLVPAAGFLAVVLMALSDWEASWVELAAVAGHLAAALLTLAPLAMVAAAGRVRLLGGTRRGEGCVAAVLLAALAALTLLEPGARTLLLLPWWSAAARLESAFAVVLDVPRVSNGAAGGWALLATAGLLHLAAAGLFLGFRRRDLERAESLVRRRRRWHLDDGRGRTWLSALARRPVGAQLTRDLRLVARRFSPAVYLAVASALLWEAGVFLVVPGLGLGTLAAQRVTVAGTLGAVLSLVALVPLVLAHQLPRFWVERTTPVRWEEVWQAKLWLAPVLALPAVAAGALALVVLSAGGEEGLGVALLQLLATSWIVASLVGLAAFEIAAQPVLGIVFSAMVSGALAVLFLFVPELWWMWAVLYFAVAGKLAERATRQVRLTEVAA